MSSDLTVIHRLVWFDDHETLDAYLTDILKDKRGREVNEQHNSFETMDKSKRER